MRLTVVGSQDFLLDTQTLIVSTDDGRVTLTATLATELIDSDTPIGLMWCVGALLRGRSATAAAT
jgi:hypothetical protein